MPLNSPTFDWSSLTYPPGRGLFIDGEKEDWPDNSVLSDTVHIAPYGTVDYLCKSKHSHSYQKRKRNPRGWQLTEHSSILQQCNIAGSFMETRQVGSNVLLIHLLAPIVLKFRLSADQSMLCSAAGTYPTPGTSNSCSTAATAIILDENVVYPTLSGTLPLQ